jgi:hypothetical protein
MRQEDASVLMSLGLRRQTLRILACGILSAAREIGGFLAAQAENRRGEGESQDWSCRMRAPLTTLWRRSFWICYEVLPSILFFRSGHCFTAGVCTSFDHRAMGRQ